MEIRQLPVLLMRGVGAFASYLLTVACLLAGNFAVSSIPAVAGCPALTGISAGSGILNLAGVICIL